MAGILGYNDRNTEGLRERTILVSVAVVVLTCCNETGHTWTTTEPLSRLRCTLVIVYTKHLRKYWEVRTIARFYVVLSLRLRAVYQTYMYEWCHLVYRCNRCASTLCDREH